MPLESLSYSQFLTLHIPSASKSSKHAPKTRSTIAAQRAQYRRNLSCILLLTQMFILHLELVIVSVIRRDIGLKTLPGSDVDGEHCEKVRSQSELIYISTRRESPLTVGLASDLSGVTVHLLPVVEHLY